ncbi:MAG: peptidase S41 [Clostridiales bacterium]|nr:peptidase S41 [Clostridiales bacterium]
MKNQWIAKWTEDIEQLRVELPKRHKNLFFQQEKSEFEGALQKLISNVEVFDYNSVVIQIARIVAAFGDAHTTLVIPSSRFIPVRFYWFSEGIYIVDTPPEHKGLLNCRLTRLGGIMADEAIERLTGIISHENDSFLKSQLPKYLSSAEVLSGLGMIKDLEKIELEVEDAEGNISGITVETCNKPEYQKVLQNDDLPLFRKNGNKHFWSFFIEEYNTLYINYNCCKDMQDMTVEMFCNELACIIKQEKVQKVVIDIRNNLGGDSTLFEPFIEEIAKCEKLNKAGGIFVVLGRDTFSSALLNAYSLKNRTAAIFVGEGTGGKPNCYGEVKYFRLNNSKLAIRYSTEYYKLINDDRLVSFFPEKVFEVTFSDYRNNVDPCMEYILDY